MVRPLKKHFFYVCLPLPVKGFLCERVVGLVGGVVDGVVGGEDVPRHLLPAGPTRYHADVCGVVVELLQYSQCLMVNDQRSKGEIINGTRLLFNGHY